MKRPGIMTEGSLNELSDGTGKPLGKTLITGHISLAGMEKGIYHSFVAAKKIPKPILQNRLIIIATNEPNCSLISMNSGICHAKVINSIRVAVKLLAQGISMLKTAPVVNTMIKKSILVANKKTVLTISCATHNFFLFAHTENNP